MLEEWIRADFKATASGYKTLWSALERRNKAIEEKDRGEGRTSAQCVCLRQGRLPD